MRDLIVTQNITVDGVIESTDGWFGVVGDDADVNATIAAQRDAADGFLVGRVTFEEMRGYWPAQTDDTTGVTDYLNGVSKYVVSTTLDDPQWDRTTVLTDSIWEQIVALKSQPGRDIVTTGSITLVSALIEQGLVDEYRLFVYPVVLGHGRRLFDGAIAAPKLRLVETRPFTSGVVLLRYRTS